MQYYRKALLALTLAIGPSLVGCEINGNGDDDYGRDADRDRISYRRPPDERPGGTPGTARLDRGVPRDAMRLQNWDGDRLTYRAPSNGMIYIVDADNNALVYSGRLRTGEQFVLDRRDNRASINDSTVFNRELRGVHNYRVYFDRN